MTTGAHRVRTDTLLRKILQSSSLEEALHQNEDQMISAPFPDYLSSLCAEKGLVPERVILRADIDRSYGHQLFNGTRRPSRDKVIQLAFGLELPLPEAQRLLQVAGKSPLYPRLRRDAVILFCLLHEKTVLEAQELLQSFGLTPLGGATGYES